MIGRSRLSRSRLVALLYFRVVRLLAPRSTVGSDAYQITVEDGIALTAPRKTSRDINRHKASNYQPG